MSETSPETKFDPHAQWENLMQGVREVLWKERKNRIRSPLPDPIPGYTDVVGVDKYGKPLVPKLYGKYVRYAFDRNGYLSTGKRSGRRNPHRSQTEKAIKNLCVETFKTEFAAFHKVATERFGTAFVGVSPEEFALIAESATVEAKREYKRRLRAKRSAKNARNLSSRQINRGLIQGNKDKQAHSGA